MYGRRGVGGGVTTENHKVKSVKENWIEVQITIWITFVRNRDRDTKT